MGRGRALSRRPLGRKRPEVILLADRLSAVPCGVAEVAVPPGTVVIPSRMVVVEAGTVVVPLRTLVVEARMVAVQARMVVVEARTVVVPLGTVVVEVRMVVVDSVREPCHPA